ncbi:MAG: threonine--tRNA ligase [Acidimicrobiia bacterium]
MSLNYELPDGSVMELTPGTTGLEAAEQIGPRLARAAVAVRLDGELRDLTLPLPEGGNLEILTIDSEEGRHVLRHSAAHVLAQAVLDLFEGAKFAIGPPIADGFYYDFDIGRPFTPDDLERIQERMSEIVAEDQPFVRDEMSRQEGLALFEDQPFKVEIIESVDESEVPGLDTVSVYRNDGFVDLCLGPHVPSTGRIAAFELLRSAGAYWRGDEKRPQLQRIYGTAWETRAALEGYLERIEEAERRDHRRLGAELDLFSFPSELGSGLAVWHPKGAIVRQVIEDYSRRVHLDRGYELVGSPHVARAGLWETSGHLDYYSDSMYPPMELGEGDDYYVKPMNCPFHILVFKSRSRSYRELPMRLFELGTVYRYERSGVVHGLMRVRGFTVDDAHMFVPRSELGDELREVLDLAMGMLSDFGFDTFEASLSTRPDEFVGDAELWDAATDALRESLEATEVPYEVAEGEGAFYGPKIDLHIRDALGRRWQMTTIQVDFSLPEKFDISYIDSDSAKVRPVMIHRALLGSVERFIGVLVEHYAGALPAWLSPVQVTIVPVADRHATFAAEVAGELGARDLRVEVDGSDATVSDKIRRALADKHPAVLVVGDEDVDHGTVGVRMRGDDVEERAVPIEDVAERLAELARQPR